MTKKQTLSTGQTLAQLEAQRAELRKQIRDARKAERAAAAAALADAQAALGRRLAEAAGATTAEEVEALWQDLDLDAVLAARQAAPEPEAEPVGTRSAPAADGADGAAEVAPGQPVWPGSAGHGGYAG